MSPGSLPGGGPAPRPTALAIALLGALATFKGASAAGPLCPAEAIARLPGHQQEWAEGDLNHDGWIDLVITADQSGASGRLDTYLGTVSGTLLLHSSYPVDIPK